MKTVIEMAREVYGVHTEWTGAPLERLTQFAALVRADERAMMAEQPAQQEPVAWMTKTGSVWKTKADETDEPLYTHPPAQRTWVGLSDEEIENLWHEFHDREFGWARRFTRAIEAKLKEKNT